MLYPGFREKIRDGVPVCGCMIDSFAPEQIEQLGILGFDFAFIDNSHGFFTGQELLTMITAGDAVGLPCLVRVCENTPSVIHHVMDCGAAGVVVPDCATPDAARLAMDALRYAPLGNRRLCTARAASYGLREELAEYVKISNEESVLICQIDSPKGVANAQTLAALDQVDALFISVTNLSHAMGYTGQYDSPEVLAAVEQIEQAARLHHCALGAMVLAGESPQDYIDGGYEMPVGAASCFFTHGAKQFLRQLRPTDD